MATVTGGWEGLRGPAVVVNQYKASAKFRALIFLQEQCVVHTSSGLVHTLRPDSA